MTDTLRIRVDGITHLCRADTTTTIGSSDDATVHVDHPGISRLHARVSRMGDAWVLEDAASTNGTFYEGARVEQLEIDDSVTVRLGHPVEGVAVELQPEVAPATAVTAPAVAASSHRSTRPPDAVPGAPDPFALQRQLIRAIWALAASILVLAAVVAVVTLS